MLILNIFFMKNNLLLKSVKYLGLVIILIAISSCSKGDFVSGSPVDSNVEFVSLQGLISTPESEVVANQSFPVTISLGTVTFPMDISVEAVALLSNSNKISRKSFIIPAGNSSVTSTMVAPSGDSNCNLPFNLDLKLYLTSITTAPEVTPKGFVGKQYSIVSNTVNLGYGDTSTPGTNSKRLGIVFDFQGPWEPVNNFIIPFNNLSMVLNKNGSTFICDSYLNTNASATGFPSSNSRPLFGKLRSTKRFREIYFLDTKQPGSLSSESQSEFNNGFYKITTQKSSNAANDKPHGFKVGDVISINSITGTSVATPFNVEVTAVPDSYTFKFVYTDAPLFESWTSASTNYTVDLSSYTTTDTYVIEVFAKTIGGNSTSAPAVDLPYKFTIRFPDETSKVYSGLISGLTIGTAASAIPKLQIVKTTVAGVSTYNVTHIE
jgi:hypothetical protein